MTSPRSLNAALLKLTAWQAAHAELIAIEHALAAAMVVYAGDLVEPPRQLIIDAEAQRAWTAKLFDQALEALDAHSIVRSGMTGFGELT